MNERDQETPVTAEVSENKILADLARISKNSIGEPLTWGATPLASSLEIKFQQDIVKSKLEKLFNQKHTPNYVSPELANYIEILNMSRTANRETHNMESFAYREHIDVHSFPAEVVELFERAVRGSASPAELLFIQDLLGIPSIELASLTHPYGQRIKLLKEMRPAVNDAITLMGGTLVKDIPPKFEVKGADNLHFPHRIQGIHMTRKTLFGHLDNGTEIMERSSFVVLVDQLPENYAKIIRTIPYENNNKNWAESVGTEGGLYKLAPELLNSDDYEKAAPVSTTVVASNAELETRLLSREAMRKRQAVFMGASALKF